MLYIMDFKVNMVLESNRCRWKSIENGDITLSGGKGEQKVTAQKKALII